MIKISDFKQAKNGTFLSMNKKGTVMLLLCVIAFIASIMIFYSNAPEKDSNEFYLGQAEIEVYNTYQQGENCLYYLDLAAQLSADQVTEGTSFGNIFVGYLDGFNTACNSSFELSDFSITVSNTKVVGESAKDIEFNEDNYVYKVKPYFEVELGVAEVQF